MVLIKRIINTKKKRGIGIRDLRVKIHYGREYMANDIMRWDWQQQWTGIVIVILVVFGLFRHIRRLSREPKEALKGNETILIIGGAKKISQESQPKCIIVFW